MLCWTWAGNLACSQGLLIQLEVFSNCSIHWFWVGKETLLSILWHSHERKKPPLSIALLFCLVWIRISSRSFMDGQENTVSCLYCLCCVRSAEETNINEMISGMTTKWFYNQFPDYNQMVSLFAWDLPSINMHIWNKQRAWTPRSHWTDHLADIASLTDS